MSKSNPPATKVVTAVDDSLYQGYVDDTLKLVRTVETSNLEFYWNIGNVFNAFRTALKAGTIKERTVQHFVADLRQQGVAEMQESTLYAAGEINKRYQYDMLPRMVTSGITVGHLKVFGPHLDNPAVRDRVEVAMIDKDGKAVSIKALQALIERAQAEAAQENARKALTSDEPPKGKAAKATKADKLDALPTEGEDVFDSKSDDDGYVAGSAPDAKADAKGNKPLETPTKGEHRTNHEKEFTVAPGKAFKTFDKHAVSATAAIADALIAAKEGVKVGFNSDRARDNFTEGLDGAIGVAQGLLDSLGPFLKQLKEARENV